MSSVNHPANAYPGLSGVGRDSYVLSNVTVTSSAVPSPSPLSSVMVKLSGTQCARRVCSFVTIAVVAASPVTSSLPSVSHPASV